MLAFFLCSFFVNLLVALIQWAMIQYSMETKAEGLISKFQNDMKAYWDKKLNEFEIAVQPA